MSVSSWLAQSTQQVAAAVQFGWGKYDPVTDTFATEKRYTTWQNGLTIAGSTYDFELMSLRFGRDTATAEENNSVQINMRVTSEPAASLLEPFPFSRVIAKIMSVNPENTDEHVVELWGEVNEVIKNPSGIREQARLVITDWKRPLSVARVGGNALNFCTHSRFGDRRAIQWEASTEYALGQIVKPSSGINNLRFVVTTAGTTGSSEPTWPTTVGGTVTDGTVTWTAEVSPGCKYNLNVVRYTGTVTSVDSADPRLVTLSLSGSPPTTDSAWKFGTLQVGDVSAQIVGFEGSGVYRMSRPAPSSWASQNCVAIEGCDRSLARCTTLQNTQNFLGAGRVMPLFNPVFENSNG